MANRHQRNNVTQVPHYCLATENNGKFEQARHIFRQFTLTLERPSYFGVSMEGMVESADSFKGNALLKAQFLAVRLLATDQPLIKVIHVFGDDSGLSIPALDNEPGVHSARWMDPEHNVKSLEHELPEYTLKRMKSFLHLSRLSYSSWTRPRHI
jgi:XTP/dITP diphosphohydrolase